MVVNDGEPTGESAPDAPPTGPVDAAPSTEAIQTVERRTWIRGISIFIGVCVLLIVLGWIAGSISNALSTTPTDRAFAELSAADDRDSVAADAATGVDATLAWSQTLGTASITAAGLPELTDGDVFQVWFIGDEGDRHAADFTASGGKASVLLEELWRPGQTVIVVTGEPGGAEPALRDDDVEPVLTFEPFTPK